MRRISTERFAGFCHQRIALLFDPALIEFLRATDMGTGHCPETRREYVHVGSGPASLRAHGLRTMPRTHILNRDIGIASPKCGSTLAVPQTQEQHRIRAISENCGKMPLLRGLRRTCRSGILPRMCFSVSKHEFIRQQWVPAKITANKACRLLIFAGRTPKSTHL